MDAKRRVVTCPRPGASTPARRRRAASLGGGTVPVRRIGALFSLVLVAGCRTATTGGGTPPGPTSNASAFAYFHQRSESIYDGDGTWGDTAYGYRMALRDSAWRAYVYGVLADQDPVYGKRADEAVAYLVRAQSEGGTGVFGFPADTNNPEFGSKVQSAIDTCPACIHNGWVVSLPGTDVAELYYDHGYALTSVARAYLRTGNQALMPAIKQGADWILDKPLTTNVNYLSALSKGLIYAYRATHDQTYLDKAIALHRDGILPNLDATGQATDAHNRQLEYHGFIVSGMIALRQSLPADDPFIATLDPVLKEAVATMASRDLQENGDYGVTWPGTNLLAWYELSSYRPLAGDEVRARDRILSLIRGYVPKVKAETDGFRLRKALYANFFIGLFVGQP